MFREIEVQRLSAGTVFKLVGLGLLLSLLPFCLLMGCLALFGASTVTWNQQPLTGIAGLGASQLIGILMAGFCTLLFGACIAFGLWVYSWFRPITLLVKTTVNKSDDPPREGN